MKRCSFAVEANTTHINASLSIGERVSKRWVKGLKVSLSIGERVPERRVRGLKLAFTLAEVLITLAIIGVVAAMTLPTLFQNINKRVLESQNTVIKTKLAKGLNLLNASGDVNNTYESTEDFLNALSKHLKMAKICNSSNLQECFPYKSIGIDKNNGTTELKAISSISTGKDLYLPQEYEDVAGFVLGDGTPFIVSYNKSCISEQDRVYEDIHPCLAGIYDINGSRRPNKYGIKFDNSGTRILTDVRGFNGGRASKCYSEIGDTCIVYPAFYPKDVMYMINPIPYRGYGIDYWDIAEQYCAKYGARLPKRPDMIDFVEKIFNTSVTEQCVGGCAWTGKDSEGKWLNTNKPENIKAIYAAMGVYPLPSDNTITLFHSSSRVSNDSDYMSYGPHYGCRFYIQTAGLGGYSENLTGRNDPSIRTLCIGD